MHKSMLRQASPEQLYDIACYLFDECGEDSRDRLELSVYKMLNGCHFNEALSRKAVSEMLNEDGSTGGYCTLDEALDAARQRGIRFVGYNEYDWYYTLNMIHSDYSDLTEDCVAFAERFLSDKDAPEGKALRYYVAMRS
jgi:pimeloyl-CoA synthetase